MFGGDADLPTLALKLTNRKRNSVRHLPRSKSCLPRQSSLRPHIATSARRLIYSNRRPLHYQSPIMAPSQLPPIFNPTPQDIEMLLAAQCHLGSKNLQVHMEPYLWKTRPDGVNVINVGKTWYVNWEDFNGIFRSFLNGV